MTEPIRQVIIRLSELPEISAAAPFLVEESLWILFGLFYVFVSCFLCPVGF